MQPDKKQTLQLVVLGVLVVVFVGFLSFNFIAPKKHAKPAEPAASTAAASKTAAPEAVSDSEDAAEPDQVAMGVFPDLASVPARRDPFMPQKVGVVEGADLPANRQPLSRPSFPAPVRNPFSRVPTLSVPPINPFSQGSRIGSSVPSVTVTRTDEPPEFVLTGVVRGEQNVAIIRSSENGRYVVKQGQLIDGRYRVLYVTPDGVVLADKHRRIHVKLGGVKNAS